MHKAEDRPQKASLRRRRHAARGWPSPASGGCSAKSDGLRRRKSRWARAESSSSDNSPTSAYGLSSRFPPTVDTRISYRLLQSLLSSVQARPSLHPSASAPPPLSVHVPQYGHGQQQQYQQHMRVPASPSTLSATRPQTAAEGRHARSEPSTAAHSRASAYDRTLEVRAAPRGALSLHHRD